MEHVDDRDSSEASDPDPAPAPTERDESVTSLFVDLATEIATLVRQELSHAAEEMAQKTRDARHNAMLVGAGALLGAVSLLVLVFALVFALGGVLPMWLSAFVTAIAIGAGSVALYRRGVTGLQAIELLPSSTFASLKEDGAWAKHEIAATRDQVSSTLGEVRRRLTLAAATRPRRRTPRAPAKRKRAGSPPA